ncbi:ATP-binding protein [Vibrio sp. TRT 21S02]|uniref:ATP-binding protein n=1 Tax=Vibrio sp. TRT 21S02 TaxID=3418507 RepID=UPI003CE73D63
MKKYNTIGTKLVIAFACSTLLLTVVSIVAWGTWNRLDGQVSELLETSVPKYNASYVLESKSSEIRHRVQLLSKVTNKVELESQIQILNEQFALITTTLEQDVLNQQPVNNELHQLKQHYVLLKSSLVTYGELVHARVDQVRQIQMLTERLDWIHQDIRSELKPMQQEFHWLIERDNKTNNGYSTFEQLRSIQQILDLESSVYEMTSELMNANQVAQVNNALKVIQYRVDDLAQSSQTILKLPSSIAYEQLLNELTILLGPEGQFHQQLLEQVSLTKRLQAISFSIERQLKSIHDEIAGLVANADNDFVKVKSDTATLVTSGNQVLLICFGLSILTSLFLAFYFINRRIVARLNALSSSIDAIIDNDLNHPIRADGNDEIGRLSHKLIEYGEKVKEIQRTNAISLINNTTASLLTCDLKGHIESANLSARKLLGIEEFIQQQPIWLSFTEVNQRALANVFQCSGELFEQGYDERTLAIEVNEHCYLHFDFRLFSHGQLEKVIVTITDVTEQESTNRELEKRVAEKTQDLLEKNLKLSQEVIVRERAEEHLRKTQGELIQAAKMAVVGQTMTSLAHELNQPLNAMSTYLFSARMFNQQGELEKVEHSISHIEGLSERMGKIINSLRNFAKKSDPDKHTQLKNLHEITEHAITIVNTKAKRQQVVIRNQLPEEFNVWANPVAIEQVLINLLVNGCEAIAESKSSKGWIDIVHLHSTPKHHVVAIADSGDGFDDGIVQQLFTPFTTTKEVGLGLGLNICKSIVERYSGHIYLASDIDRGALVILELPYEQQ